MTIRCAMIVGGMLASSLCGNPSLNKILDHEIEASLPAQAPHVSSCAHASGGSVLYKQNSFKHFITNVYNDFRYADILSRDPAHLIAVFKLITEINLTPDDLSMMIRLYANKFKSCEIIDPIVFEQVSHSIPHEIKQLFKTQRSLEAANASEIEDLMLSCFTEKFHCFEQDPGVFLHKLARSICRLKMKYDGGAMASSLHSLRCELALLYEIMLSRVLWDIKQPQGVFESFVIMGKGILLLAHHGILNKEVVDGLLWTLSCRLSFYIDLTGGLIPLEFYDHARDLLLQGEIYFLEYPELVEGIISKKETILRAIEKSRVKAVAFEKGLITNNLGWS